MLALPYVIRDIARPERALINAAIQNAEPGDPLYNMPRVEDPCVSWECGLPCTSWRCIAVICTTRERHLVGAKMADSRSACGALLTALGYETR